MKDMMVKGTKARLTYINQTPNHIKINPFRPNQTSVKSYQIMPDLCVAKVRRKDGCLGLEVQACLALCADLPAVEAVYHTNCRREFLNGRRCSKVRE